MIYICCSLREKLNLNINSIQSTYQLLKNGITLVAF